MNKHIKYYILSILITFVCSNLFSQNSSGIDADGNLDLNKKGLRMGWFDDDRKPSKEGEPGAEWVPDVINPFLGNKLNF